MFTPEDYGAAGDGIANDQPAWQAMLDALPDDGAIIRAKGRYRFAPQSPGADMRAIVTDKRNICFDLRGATLFADGGCHLILCNRSGPGIDLGVIYVRGGTFDGRRAYHKPPPTREGWPYFTQGNQGLFTVQRALKAVFKGVTLVNCVREGLVARECHQAFFKDCHGMNSEPRNFGAHGDQFTMFKVRGEESIVGVWHNVTCYNGSIGMQFSNDHAHQNSIAAFINCESHHMAQNTVHCEHVARHFDIGGCYSGSNYRIGNEARASFMLDVQNAEGRPTLENPQSGILGLWSNVTAEWKDQNGEFTLGRVGNLLDCEAKLDGVGHALSGSVVLDCLGFGETTSIVHGAPGDAMVVGNRTQNPIKFVRGNPQKQGKGIRVSNRTGVVYDNEIRDAQQPLDIDPRIAAEDNFSA